MTLQDALVIKEYIKQGYSHKEAKILMMEYKIYYHLNNAGHSQENALNYVQSVSDIGLEDYYFKIIRWGGETPHFLY